MFIKRSSGFFGQRMMALLYSNIQKNEVNYKLEHYYIKNYYKCKLFFINTFWVKIFLILMNQQVTKAHSMLVGTSEHIRLLSKLKNKNSSLNEWLGGLIDGDGYFHVSQKNYASLEITMDIRDSNCLYFLKSIFGGSLKLRAGTKSIRYRLHDKKGLILLLIFVNSNIRLSKRILQYTKVLNLYNINFIEAPKLIFNNGWLSGFFDSDGTVSINFTNLQLSISISQKEKYILDIIKEVYGGFVYIDRSSNTFKWYITKKEEILILLDYFKKYTPRSEKKNRLHLIPRFYDLVLLKKINKSIFEKNLLLFKKSWDNYSLDKDMYQN